MPYYLLANSVFSDVCERERNALCNEELALLNVEREAYTKLPLEEILVEGQAMLFMVDSGATNSVIRKDEFPFVTLSGQFNSSMSASGHIVREEFTAPLCCMHDGNEFMHMFLLSDACPVNLMGRDLMCKMNASILCNNQGLSISCWDPRMLSICLSLLHVYEWAFRSEELFAEGKIRLPQTSEVIPADNMHCTAHVVETTEREWEEKWFSIKTEGLTITHICWNDSWCVALVKLTEKQGQIFDVENSVPHVSIAKNTSQPWEKAGEFAKACSEAVDWEMLSDNVQFSEQIRAHRRSCVSFFIAERERVVIQEAVSVDSNPQNSLPARMTCASIDLPQEVFDNVPDHLWAKDKYDVGLIKGCEPVIITPKSDYRPCKPQYPLKREALEGIRPVFEALLEKGIIVPCPNSPVRTPIFPVQKVRDAGQPTEWRFVQDLQAVNAAVQVRAPNVPNPYTILSQIPADSQWFSVVDISNAFFSVPVHPDSQFWFAFTFEGKNYTFTRLCQGYAESPTIYNSALHCSLQTLVLDDDVALLQYVDDLLVAAPTRQSCTDNTIRLLTHLAEEGHKVNPKKVQCSVQKVTFLGHEITPMGKSLSPKRIEAIANIPKPITKKQVMSFLGMTSYCRTFIANYSEMQQPLHDMIYEKPLAPSEKVEWTEKAERAFVELKQTLQQAPTLGLPDQKKKKKPFIQTVDERNGCMTSVLLQEHGDKLRPVAYFSGRLDAVARGLPGCLRAVAAAEKAVQASSEFVGYAQLRLLVSSLCVSYTVWTAHISLVCSKMAALFLCIVTDV
ncbi:uncharacterized protein [Paramisgurnus dabryanus]|uniref:uncharacterized protein n=1 Tax=Paramisgurnus dabryanus TaxID=90735 RepID=UPI0031F4127E